MAAGNTNQFGLIILGNSGVGKSFLANVLLDKEIFKHEFSARSVTHRTEFQEITIGEHRYAIFNVPGLIEADQTRVDVNKREIDHAFKLRPNSIILYVFGQQGGRIRDEDVVAFNAINSAYPLADKSLLLVINGLPISRPENYEAEVMLMLQDIVQMPVREDHVCFLNHIDRKSSEERQELKRQLLSVIVELTPAEHIKAHDIHLRVDDVTSLKKKIEEMTKAFQENKIYFENEIREQQRRYDALIADRKDDRDFFQRIIDRQSEESGELRQIQTTLFSQIQDSQKTQVLAMERQMETMQNEYQRRIEEMETQNTEQARITRETLRQSLETQNVLSQKISELKKAPPPVSNDNSCFVAGTLVHMADGINKPIEKIQVGDRVLGVDNQPHSVMFLDVEKLDKRYLYGINNVAPFFTSEHIFLTVDGTMVAMEPMASEREEPSLQGLVKPLRPNFELQGLVENRSSTIMIEQLTCIESDSSINVYNVVLESGHTYYVNGFCVFDMFPNLSQYPRMFKLLHLLWRNCATQIDAHFDDVITPGSTDRIRLEQLAEFVQEAISVFLLKN